MMSYFCTESTWIFKRIPSGSKKKKKCFMCESSASAAKSFSVHSTNWEEGGEIRAAHGSDETYAEWIMYVIV